MLKIPWGWSGGEVKVEVETSQKIITEIHTRDDDILKQVVIECCEGLKFCVILNAYQNVLKL